MQHQIRTIPTTKSSESRQQQYGHGSGAERITHLNNKTDNFMTVPLFSSSWSDFENDRNLMMKKTGDFWDTVEKDMLKFESGLAQIEKDMNQRMAPHQPSVPDWALTPAHKQFPQFSTSSPGINNFNVEGFRSHTIKDAPDEWELEVDVGEYDPEGIKLSVSGDTVIVRAGKSTLEMKANNQSSFSQSIERRFQLPEGCITEKLTSRLTKDNILKVHCPRNLYLFGPTKRAIRSAYH
eukprot:TRINITY_DN13597_c0_g1_i1.p1 TRINITY_DN13597_c0_g1~~TRINITY_DN13597_c0_g1_i1.p1  ORF type:complete len:237 (-),score=58.60 TRINITY_DN13597_c0_g1_i1:214-924(-)